MADLPIFASTFVRGSSVQESCRRLGASCDSCFESTTSLGVALSGNAPEDRIASTAETKKSPPKYSATGAEAPRGHGVGSTRHFVPCLDIYVEESFGHM